MTTKKSKDSSGSKLERQILGQDLTFGMAVEALRVRDGLTQAKFAKKLGVSRQYLCDVEKGRRLLARPRTGSALCQSIWASSRGVSSDGSSRCREPEWTKTRGKSRGGLAHGSG
jgi:DNA-binding XRE family transcriptional regulator